MDRKTKVRKHQPKPSGRGKAQAQEPILLTPKGEVEVRLSNTLPEAPPNKAIHARRPLPVVPTGKK